MIKSDNQELIHHIRVFLGYVFYHQNMMRRLFWFHWLLLHNFYFGFYLSNVSNIYYSAKHLCVHYDLLLREHIHCNIVATSLSPLQSRKKEYTFGFNKHIVYLTPTVLSFILATTNLFESSWYFDLDDLDFDFELVIVLVIIY